MTHKMELMISAYSNMCIIIVLTLLLLLPPARDQGEPQRFVHLQGWSRLESCELALEEISNLHCLFVSSEQDRENS